MGSGRRAGPGQGAPRCQGRNLITVFPLAVHPLGGDHPPGRCGGEVTLCRAFWELLHPLTLTLTLQDLKPSNVAVNEDCELRVSAGGQGIEEALLGALTPGVCSRSWTSGWHARRTRR